MSEMFDVGLCTIVQGDNLETLRLMPAESIHSCVTDPPYGIGFMGKKWDTFKPGVAESRIIVSENDSDNPNLKGRSRSPASSPSAVEYDRSLMGQRGFQSWTEEWAREAFRVLKPGGHMLICGAPRSFHRMASGVEDAGFEIRDCIMWVFGQGFPKSHNLADEWDGWGTALKPGWEPIVVARKPLVGTVAANMALHRVGAINIDGCRIGGEGEQGRWPANLIHDGSPEVLVAFPTVTSGKPAGIKAGGKSNCYSAFAGGIPVTGYGDTGSAARFFYCAKTSKTDRDEGLDAQPDRVLAMSNQAKAELARGNMHVANSGMNSAKVRKNNHPTVKPTALMRYLVRLVTPPGGFVLDPFFGSGSTGKACVLEGFNCIGIEQEPDYVAIARARVEHAATQKLV